MGVDVGDSVGDRVRISVGVGKNNCAVEAVGKGLEALVGVGVRAGVMVIVLVAESAGVLIGVGVEVLVGVGV